MRTIKIAPVLTVVQHNDSYLSPSGIAQGEEIQWSHMRTVTTAQVLAQVQYNDIYLSNLGPAQG